MITKISLTQVKFATNYPHQNLAVQTHPSVYIMSVKQCKASEF